MGGLKKGTAVSDAVAPNIYSTSRSLPDVDILNKGQTLKIRIREEISIFSPPDEIYHQIIRDNTFPNPKFESNQQHGYSNWKISETIETFRLFPRGILVPRGYLPKLLDLCEGYNISVNIEDCRVVQPVAIPFLEGVTLRCYQEKAVNDALHVDQGVIISPTGSGKTLIALEIIRRRRQKALVVVHRSDLAAQWADVINQRMGIDAGFIGDGKWRIGDEITLAMVQTLASRSDDTIRISDCFGTIICDECHHCPAKSFYDVLGLFPTKYRYGLSATPVRRDGLEQLIYRSIGPTITIIEKNEIESVGAIVPVFVQLIETGFDPGVVSSWNEYLDALCADPKRNLLIIELIQRSVKPTLVLCDRIAHAQLLSDMLARRGINHVLAHGQLSKSAREDVMHRVSYEKITVGTVSLLGEGLDVAHWSILVMASPISSETKLMQAIGRVVRPFKNKDRSIVYDLRDDCGFAGASFKNRFAIYKKHNIWVNFNDN